MTTLKLAAKGVLKHLQNEERKTTQKIKPEIQTRNTLHIISNKSNYLKYETLGFP